MSTPSTYDENNIFAKILRGEIPCDKIYEDEFTLCFKDITPKAPTHLLVIPKGAYLNIVDFGKRASKEEIDGFFKAVSQIAEEQNLSQSGFRSIANTGLNGGQEVPHFHLHLLGGKKLGALVGQ
ncbi:MAG: histidine triad nucleotide-binding protein [Alphaproteobacteria bacterium]|nr:histidine triad nucleotide-binding protein [Alphaproteobacteria bacterium]